MPTNNFADMTTEERRNAAVQARETRKARKVEAEVSNITFGIEIECYVSHAALREFGVVVGDYHRGASLPAEYFPYGWTAERDGSLVDAPAGFMGVEFVSPPLKGTDGIKQARAVIELLEKPMNEGGMGARVTNKCGQHVHIGMPSVLGTRSNDFEMVSEWVRRLLHLVAKNETALFAITGNATRLNNTYCASVKNDWKERAGTSLSYTGLQRGAEYVDRYHTLNLKNLFTSKRTVEFRIFGATLNSKKTTSYIVTAIGLAQKAAANTAVASWDDTPTIATANAEYYTAAVLDLQSRLGWLKSNVTHFGFTEEAWTLWGTEVRKVQMWNAKHLAETVAGRNR